MARNFLGLFTNRPARKYIYTIGVLILLLPIIYFLLIKWTKNHKNPLANDLRYIPLPEITSKRSLFDDKIPDVPNDDITCYEEPNESLPNISSIDAIKPRSIFFIDTSCASHKTGRIVVKRRAACAVESAARAHPKRKIYLLYASPGKIRNYGTESDRLLASLKGYKNIHILHVNVTDLAKHSPLEAYYRFVKSNGTGKLYPDIKNLLRLLVLWKFGGIYMDFDIMVLRAFSTLNHNFVIVDRGTIDNAIVSMCDDIGHKYLSVVLNQYRSKYDVQLSEYNQGSPMVSVISKKCRKDIKRMVSQSCHGLFVYSSNKFFPINIRKWKTYFDEDKHGKVVQNLRQNYTIRLWEQYSSNARIMLNSTSPYLRLARQYCPEVVRQLTYYF